jgi:hypothetical protein
LPSPATSQTFNTYQVVDQALRNLILAAVPPVYVNSLSHDITGFGNVSALTIMTSQSRIFSFSSLAEVSLPPIAQSPLRFLKFFALATG